MVDDKSCFTWIFIMKLKSEASNIVKSFVTLIQNDFNSTIKSICTDNGVEFILTDFYSSKGIIHQNLCVVTLQQNEIVECKHQHILGLARAFLFHVHISLCFRGYVIKHVVHFII